MDFNFGKGPLNTTLSGKEVFDLMKELQEKNHNNLRLVTRCIKQVT